ncbi:hypothetical protein GF1_31290 [Desulfolithobacter dissulfuricans]|uniref:Uncharacterized protein n=2 Tax=Desulfolithobacter dissulfuricans TaxID=2795293 RepID=A0A915XLG8_9BACT|nr:hypothetical protein GF1_31290 [Desulfolithobacter dissulfuricans]
MILISPHVQADRAGMAAEMGQGLRDDGLSLSLVSNLEPEGGDILAGTYRGVLAGREIKARGFGILSPHGGGIYVLALALVDEFSSELEQAGRAVARSIQFSRPRAAQDNPLIGTWKDIRGSGHTLITLYPDGTFTWYRDYAASGQGWGFSNRDESTGRWQSRGTHRAGTIFYQTSEGEQGSMDYRVLVEKGEAYWNEYYFDGTLFVRQ